MKRNALKSLRNSSQYLWKKEWINKFKNYSNTVTCSYFEENAVLWESMNGPEYVTLSEKTQVDEEKCYLTHIT